jgi:hypothetical protein
MIYVHIARPVLTVPPTCRPRRLKKPPRTATTIQNRKLAYKGGDNQTLEMIQASNDPTGDDYRRPSASSPSRSLLEVFFCDFWCL